MSTEAYILVGGRSSRLGRDKAFERVGGQTLAERALRTVQQALPGGRMFFVTGSDVGFAIEAARLDAHFIFDLVEGRGPLGGLHAALMHSTAEWIFLLACDLPFVTPELISSLREYTHGDTRSGAVLPEQPDGRLQPLCAFYNVARARPVVDEIIHRPRPSPPMHEVAALLDPRIVTASEYAPDPDGRPVDYFVNVNTDEDLEAARKSSRAP